jgi:hypothetical protein
VLAAKAPLNSAFRVMCPKETSVFVTVVPMFAPIIIGIAVPKSRVPLAIRATTMEVVALLLWIKEVASMPANNPAMGLDTLPSTRSANGCPMAFTASPIPTIERRKIYNPITNSIDFSLISIVLPPRRIISRFYLLLGGYILVGIINIASLSKESVL